MVAKSNYTDPVMSSSLQNVNGMSLYHPSSPSSSSNIGQIASRNNRYLSSSQPSYQQLYDTKSNTSISQNSLSPIMRDSSGYIKSVSPPTTNNVSYQNAIYAHQKQQQQYYGSIGKTQTPPGLNRSGLNDVSGYGTAKNQHHSSSSSHKNSHHNILTSSDTNLAKLFINSSDESVCSSSSRDLNLSSSQNQNTFQVYGTSKLKTAGGSTKNLNVWGSDYGVTSNQPKQPPPASSAAYNETPIASSNNNTGIPKKQQRGHNKDDLVKAKPYNIQQNW